MCGRGLGRGGEEVAVGGVVGGATKCSGGEKTQGTVGDG